MEDQEMRNDARVNTSCPVDVLASGASEPEHSFLTDLSLGGAFVQTRRSLRRGDRLFLRVALGDDDVAGLATEVTWVRRFEPISVDGRLPGVGVRFLDVSPADRQRLRGFLSSAARARQGEVESVDPDHPGCVMYDDEPLLRWHDTDVDDDAPAAAAEEQFFTGHEPELGMPSIPVQLTAPPVRSPRALAHRRLTYGLAAASLILGVGAGAVYGVMAPDGAPTAAQRELMASREQEQAPVVEGTPTAELASPQVANAAPAVAEPAPLPALVAVPVVTPAVTTSAQPAVEKSAPPAVEKPSAPVVAKVVAKPAVAAPAKVVAIAVGAPKKLGAGWALLVQGGATATKSFALQGPVRAVVDVPARLASQLSARDYASGPFTQLRVGKQGSQARLVFDLRGVASRDQVRFVTKGADLSIEVTNPTVAHR